MKDGQNIADVSQLPPRRDHGITLAPFCAPFALLSWYSGTIVSSLVLSKRNMRVAMNRPTFLLFAACFLLSMTLSFVNGFASQTTTQGQSSTALAATNSPNAPNNHAISRRSALSWTAATTLASIALPTQPANAAKQVDPALKGTKKDPAYEACVSQCMYDCTKPKGVEQKSRQECLPECKKQCATTKEQLMVGTPTSK